MSVVRLSDWTTVSCAGCGEFFELSDRANRSRIVAGREPVCRDCRFPSVVVVTDPLIEWWRARVTPAEALSMAEALFGPREEWTSRLNPIGLEGCTGDGFTEMMSA